MANRKQRRDTKKIMNKPELKKHVDKMCMDMAAVLIEHCERASQEAKETGKELRFEDMEDKVKDSMAQMGTQMAEKVKEIAKTYKQSQNVPFKVNIR